MALTTLLVLLCVIVGAVLAIVKKEYTSGTFWLIVALVLTQVVPLL